VDRYVDPLELANYLQRMGVQAFGFDPDDGRGRAREPRSSRPWVKP
jgi:hypothetical protein